MPERVCRVALLRCGTSVVRASNTFRVVRVAAGTPHRVKTASGMAFELRPIGGRTAILKGGVHSAGRVTLRTGSRVPAAGPSITPSLIGEARRAGRGILSQKGCSPSLLRRRPLQFCGRMYGDYLRCIR